MDLMRRRHDLPLNVTIIASSPETLDGLESYLRGVGVNTNGTRHIEKIVEMTPPSSAAVVLFPDDFGAPSVFAALHLLRIERSHALVVLVTRAPKQFEFEGQGDKENWPLVVPKPVWGWTLLDAIRARA